MARVKGGANPVPLALSRRGRKSKHEFVFMPPGGSPTHDNAMRASWADALSRIQVTGETLVVLLPGGTPESARHDRKVIRASINKSAKRRFLPIATEWDRKNNLLLVRAT